MKIEVTDLRNDRDDSFVATQLSTYNATFTVRDFRLLRVFARNADGSIIGGYGSTDRHAWFMLWNPATGDTTNVNGVKRGNFRLHPMGPLRLSEGCITVVNPDAFDGLQKYIRSQGLTTPVPGTTKKAYGTVEVK